MARRDLIVLGASAGGVEALVAIVRALPVSLPAAVMAVVHVPADGESRLPHILARAGRLEVTDARTDGELRPGRLFVAPRDHHLTVRRGRAHVSRGPRVNRHRPAIDPLFRTAAEDRGARTIGVILSGTLDDGTSGMIAIRRRGGVTIVQDPEDAIYGGMPRSVLEQTAVDHVLPASRIAELLVRLAGEPVPDGAAVPEEEPMEDPDEDLEAELTPAHDPDRPPSGFTCPDCAGALWLVGRDGLRFRCRVGHAYGAKGLFAAQADALEEALWSAYRALEESAALSTRLATRAVEQGLPVLAERYTRKVDDAKRRTALLRSVLENGNLAAGLGDEPEKDDPSSEDA
jgi:two-component system, chemotaxis family, protein-glutamate methylesterase/glutaminase